MKKFFSFIWIIALILTISCSIQQVDQNRISATQSNIIKLDKESCPCDSLEFIDINERQAANIWSDFTSSGEFKEVNNQLKKDGFLVNIKNRAINKYYCHNYRDTVISINIPYTNKDRESKLELRKIFLKSSNKSIFVVSISKFSVNSLRSIVVDSSYVFITVDETSPINSEQEYPEYSIFNTGTNEFYYSISTLPGLGTVTITPTATISDEFSVCFGNCYDPCAYSCFGQHDQNECLSRCYNYCYTKCIIASFF